LCNNNDKNRNLILDMITSTNLAKQTREKEYYTIIQWCPVRCVFLLVLSCPNCVFVRFVYEMVSCPMCVFVSVVLSYLWFCEICLCCFVQNAFLRDLLTVAYSNCVIVCLCDLLVLTIPNCVFARIIV
jgi:hypothetical protein